LRRKKDPLLILRGRTGTGEELEIDPLRDLVFRS
jgi:hypothetical protein